MQGLWSESRFNNYPEPKWWRVVLLSLFIHVAVFSVVFFIPQDMPARKIGGTVYEVDLVEMPQKRLTKAPRTAPAKPRKTRTIAPKKAAPAKRISPPRKKERPLTVAKRVVEKKTKKPERPKVSPSKLIDRAVARVERDIKTKEEDPIAQALSKLEHQIQEDAEKEATPGGAAHGISMRMYQMMVENKIKGNWAYPVALDSNQGKKDLVAVVLVKVRSDGSILDFSFAQKSSSAMFDRSVRKAIERSDPLPPFPEGYRRTYDEIEINFNLSELDNY